MRKFLGQFRDDLMTWLGNLPIIQPFLLKHLLLKQLLEMETREEIRIIRDETGIIDIIPNNSLAADLTYLEGGWIKLGK